MVNEEIQKYQRLLIYYFQKNHSEKLKYRPKAIEVNQDNEVFGMTKHVGILTLKIEHLIISIEEKNKYFTENQHIRWG